MSRPAERKSGRNVQAEPASWENVLHRNGEKTHQQTQRSRWLRESVRVRCHRVHVLSNQYNNSLTLQASVTALSIPQEVSETLDQEPNCKWNNNIYFVIFTATLMRRHGWPSVWRLIRLSTVTDMQLAHILVDTSPLCFIRLLVF